MKNKILIVSGDPESINSEIIFKAWKKIPNSLRRKIYLISNFNLLDSQLKKLGYKIKLLKINNFNSNNISDKLKIINVNLSFKDPFKFNTKILKKYISQSLNLAHEMAIKDKKIAGIINCPIRKDLLGKKGLGVTEYLASKCFVNDNSEVMLIKANNLSVSPLTTHVKLRDVAKIINKKLILTKIKSINYNFKKIFKKKPKIAILGLNPHNSELRKNSDERKKIIPAIKLLKKSNIKVYGPYVADTIFINDYKNFDVIVGMYHDQVLAPFKALYKFNAINVTLGLKYLRVSPDHGVAKNLIGKNKAHATSLIESIKFINSLS